MRTLCGTIFAAVMLAAGLGCERRGDAASFAEFDARARAGENLTVAYFGCSLVWSANASEPNETETWRGHTPRNRCKTAI